MHRCHRGIYTFVYLVLPAHSVRTLSLLFFVQIHLTYLSDTQTIVSWATGYGNTTVSPVDPTTFRRSQAHPALFTGAPTLATTLTT